MDLVAKKESKMVEIKHGNQIGNMVYNFFSLWYCGLYEWVKYKNDSKMNFSKAMIYSRIHEIAKLCEDNFHKIKSLLPNCEYDEDQRVYFDEEKDHIRFPVFRDSFDWHDTSIKLEFRVRISPCGVFNGDKTFNGKHSKIWIIIRNINSHRIKSVDLSAFFKQVEEVAKKIEKMVSDSYVNIIEEKNQRKQEGSIAIRAVALEPEQDRISEMFKNFKKGGDVEEDLRTNPNLLRTSKDIFILSQKNNDQKDSTQSFKDISNDILQDHEDRLWQTGQDNNSQSIQRIFAPDSSFLVGKIVDAVGDNEDIKNSLYRNCRRMALDFTWVA